MTLEEARKKGVEAARNLAAARGALITALQACEEATEAFGAVWPELGSIEYGEARIAAARWGERTANIRSAIKIAN